MNARELIEKLQKCDDLDQEIYIWFEDELHTIDIVDDSISDRIDININEKL